MLVKEVTLLTLFFLEVTVASQRPYYHHHARKCNDGNCGGGSNLDSGNDDATIYFKRDLKHVREGKNWRVSYEEERGETLEVAEEKLERMREEGRRESVERDRIQEEEGKDEDMSIWSLFKKDYGKTNNPALIEHTSGSSGQLLKNYTSFNSASAHYTSVTSTTAPTHTQTLTFPVSNDRVREDFQRVSMASLHTPVIHKIGAVTGDSFDVSENHLQEAFKHRSQQHHSSNIKVSEDDSRVISISSNSRGESFAAPDQVTMHSSRQTVNLLKKSSDTANDNNGFDQSESEAGRSLHSEYPIATARFVANPNLVHLIEEVDEEELERLKESTTSSPAERVTGATPTETVTVHYEATKVPFLTYIWTEFVNLGDLLGREVLDTVSNRLRFLWRSALRFVKSRGRRALPDTS